MIRMRERYIGDDGTLTRQGYATFAPLERSRVQVQTAVVASGQTFVDFTGVPAWANRITVTMAGFSTSGTNAYFLRVGAGSVANAGYTGARTTIAGATPVSGNPTAEVQIGVGPVAGAVYRGLWTIQRHSGNTWVIAGQGSFSDTATTHFASAEITLSGDLDRVRITSSGGSDTFDAGSINVSWD
jgi:hypothetical protein